jgi:hypothetical protein
LNGRAKPEVKVVRSPGWADGAWAAAAVAALPHCAATLPPGRDGVGIGSMQRIIKLLLITLGVAVAYAAWPVYSALVIREAILTGDAHTLAERVEWEPLRASLKSSLSPETLARLEADSDAPKPTLWQRVKALVAPKVAETVIDRYVTPESLPILLGYQRKYREHIRPALGLKEPPTVLAGTWLAGGRIDRFASFWARVKGAVFHSPTRFVLDVQDKFHPERHYVGTLELRDWTWKLTGLDVSGSGL